MSQEPTLLKAKEAAKYLQIQHYRFNDAARRGMLPVPIDTGRPRRWSPDQFRDVDLTLLKGGDNTTPKSSRKSDRSVDALGASNLTFISNTLQYCMEAFRDSCECGKCGPCTKGQRDIDKALSIIERGLAVASIATPQAPASVVVESTPVPITTPEPSPTINRPQSITRDERGHLKPTPEELEALRFTCQGASHTIVAPMFGISAKSVARLLKGER